MLRGQSSSAADTFFSIVIIGILVGARVGHVLFYEPGKFIHDPLLILKFWRGGLASHGAIAGLIIAMWYYSRRYKMPMLEAIDIVSVPIAIGSSLIRLGNFFNSEIVGRATDVPWAIIFIRYDSEMGLPPTPRHPSQLYEVVMGLTVFVLLYLADRRFGGHCPTGLKTGILFASYFTLRFFVEFFKEYQVLYPSFPLTMGHLLSIPFAILGFFILSKSLSAARH
jgi:phosphatidylglycerol:prolipoprotein diacylglycerol transferase